MREIALRSPQFAELAAEVLRRGDRFRFRASGGSMVPFVLPGDVLTVTPSWPRLGEVALCVQEGRAVAHRVVANRLVGGRVWLRTRGDAQTVCGRWVRPDDVLGRVVGLERSGRRIRLDRGLVPLAAGAWLRIFPLSARLVRLLLYLNGHFFKRRMRSLAVVDEDAACAAPLRHDDVDVNSLQR